MVATQEADGVRERGVLIDGGKMAFGYNALMLKLIHGGANIVELSDRVKALPAKYKVPQVPSQPLPVAA